MDGKKVIVAFGSDDGVRMKTDDHCGQSKYYCIYEIDKDGFNFIEKRENKKYSEDETRKDGDPGKAATVSSVLKGVDVLVCNIFGPNIKRMLIKFVCVVSRKETVEEAAELIVNNFDLILEKLSESNRKALILK